MHNTARQRLVQADTDYGVVTDNTVRTAAQIGNESGAADFGVGVTTQQTLRVALASDTGFVNIANNFGVYASNDMPAIPVGATTVIVAYIPATAHNLKRASFSGDADANYIIKIGGVAIDTKRNNWCDRNASFDYGENGIPVPAGTTITLEVFSKGATARAFSATLYGEEV